MCLEHETLCLIHRRNLSIYFLSIMQFWPGGAYAILATKAEVIRQTAPESTEMLYSLARLLDVRLRFYRVRVEQINSRLHTASSEWRAVTSSSAAAGRSLAHWANDLQSDRTGKGRKQQQSRKLDMQHWKERMGVRRKECVWTSCLCCLKLRFSKELGHI